MRRVSLLPFALAATVAAGGCGPASDGAEQTASRPPRRDLTLSQAEAPEVEVASPVELARAPVQRRAAPRPERARRPARVPRPVAAEPESASAASVPTTVPVPAPAQAEPVHLAARTDSEAPDPHALAPGQTVTAIPVSNGPSSAGPMDAPTGTDQLRGDDDGIHGGVRGGGCKPRGTGRRPGGTRGGGFRGLY